MSATTQYTDYSDLYTGLQQLVRVQTGVTATENQAKRFINIGLRDMHIGFGERFPWAMRNAVLVTQDNYTTGTLAISQGDTALTGTSTLWNTNNAFGVANVRVGGKMVISGGEEVYEIASVGSDTAAVLTSDYVKSDASGASYEYFEDEYTLASDFLRPLDQRYFDQRRTIPLMQRREFRMRFPRNKTSGKIIAAMLIDKAFSGNTTRQRRIVFHKPPDEAFMIAYEYVTNNLAVASDGTEQLSLSADADEPIVPFQYRHLIVHYGLYTWYRDKKNDVQRAQFALQEYRDLLSRVVSDTEIGASRPQLRPRLGMYKSGARRPWSGTTRRYQIGSRFDEIR